MKILTSIALASLLATASMVYAGNDHNHAGSDKAGGMPMGSMPMAGQSGMMSMSEDMQKKMMKMKADMMMIQKEKDPEKRKSMMKAHMQDMQGMMGMMKGEREIMKAKHLDQMKQLETRVTMMEAMMEQIMSTHITALDPNDPIYQLQ